MKKVIIVGLLLMLLAPGILAAEEGSAKEKGSGIEADSKFYFLDKAKEKIDLFLASDEEKAKLKLKHGYERLAEAKNMLEKDKMDKAKQLMKEGVNDLAQATKMATDDLMSQEEWKQIKRDFTKLLTELKVKITSGEFTQQIKDFFNPSEEEK